MHMLSAGYCYHFSNFSQRTLLHSEMRNFVPKLKAGWNHSRTRKYWSCICTSYTTTRKYISTSCESRKQRPPSSVLQLYSAIQLHALRRTNLYNIGWKFLTLEVTEIRIQKISKYKSRIQRNPPCTQLHHLSSSDSYLKHSVWRRILLCNSVSMTVFAPQRIFEGETTTE